MLPVPRFVARVPFRQAPSVFQLHYSDRFFAAWAWTGCAVSVALIAGLDSTAALGRHVALAGALGAVSVDRERRPDLVRVRLGVPAPGDRLPRRLPGQRRGRPPVVVLFLLRWILFRVEFGAGLIKMRGDACWRKLTCLDHHHETQPMPGPLSWFFHHLPRSRCTGWRWPPTTSPNSSCPSCCSPLSRRDGRRVPDDPHPAVADPVRQLLLAELDHHRAGPLRTELPGTAPDVPGAPLWYEVVVLAVAALLVAELPPGPQHDLPPPDHEPLLRPPPPGEHLRGVRQRQPYPVRGGGRGHADAVPREDSDWREYEFRASPAIHGAGRASSPRTICGSTG
jgi:hypothetical protein